MNQNDITLFRGEYSWLSNFYNCDIIYQEYKYFSVEHAYQAAKTYKEEDLLLIRNSVSSVMAKSNSKLISIRSDWSEVKLDIMDGLLRQKFSKNSELADKLIDTGDVQIIEGNDWGDTYWGVCNGLGKNYLGKLLMNIRYFISNDSVYNL